MRLFIRTEASSQIGMGHFMRCFAIAEEARSRDIAVVFLLNEIGETVKARLDTIGAQGMAIDGSLGDAADFMTMSGLDLTHGDWLLIDSYGATEDYIALQKNAVRVAVIDDLNALENFACDLIINPAQSAIRADYERKTRAKLLLGVNYALIRKEFLAETAPIEKKATVTIMFGGSDPAQLTARCAQAVHAVLPKTDIHLIAGPANQHTDDLMQFARESDRIRVFISPESVADVLAGSALVITAAGGSVGEVAAMGLPALVLVVYDNQAAALKACPFPVIDVRNGLPDDLGIRVKALIDDAPKRAEIAQKAHAVVDGLGPQRIVEAMLNV